MEFSGDFQRALAQTVIHRHRRTRLLTVGTTELPYVLLSESKVNLGDVAVRSGLVRVEKPNIVLLQPPLDFEGFEEQDRDKNVIMAVGRMASFPPGKYSNIDNQLDIFEGTLDIAVAHYQDRLDRSEDLMTGVIAGPVDLWPMSLLVYIGTTVARQAPEDFQDYLTKRFTYLPPSWS